MARQLTRNTGGDELLFDEERTDVDEEDEDEETSLDDIIDAYANG